MTTARTRTGDPAVYKAMQVVIGEGLRHDGSAFTPGEAVWTGANFASLREHFINQPDVSKDSYLVKLEGQLDGADDKVIQLMAELHYTHLLLPETVSGKRKHEIITSILAFMDSPVEVPEELRVALDHGFVNPGTHFMTRRDSQLSFLIELGETWKGITAAEQADKLADPWAFKSFVFDLPIHSAYAQREGLLHLIYPETFEAIVSREHKQLIAKRFSSLVGDPDPDVDRQLEVIRSELTSTYGSSFDFYDDRVRPQWQGDGSGSWDQFIKWATKFYAPPAFDTDERDFKFAAVEPIVAARAALSSGSEWRDDLRRGFTNSKNNLTDFRSHSRFLDWVNAQLDTGSDTPAAALSALWDSGDVAAQVDNFLGLLPASEFGAIGAQINIASYLLMAEDATQYPPYKPQPFTRALDLTQMPSPAGGASPSEVYLAFLDFLDRVIEEAATRGLQLRDRLDAQSLVWCVTKYEPPTAWSKEDRLAFDLWRGGETPEDESTLDQLARKLHLAEGSDFLDRVTKLLGQKGQVIFHGPPGTGKTYVARKLAEHLAGTEGSVELVQFHPSYSYEDFVQGYRPSDGGGGFTLTDGPLLRAAKRASESSHGTHVLIIDEINRGNLAKVLGELYFLLEYRKSEITLQYSNTPFRLPENLWVIGTMNTADRSIAIVDGALRRRFYFVPFFPSEPPVEDLLRRWLSREHSDLLWIADVVDRANELLGDRHAAVGPSHFMREDLDEEWIELVWDHSVLPYITEQLFGDDERIGDFALEKLRNEKPTPEEPDDQQTAPAD